MLEKQIKKQIKKQISKYNTIYNYILYYSVYIIKNTYFLFVKNIFKLYYRIKEIDIVE